MSPTFKTIEEINKHVFCSDVIFEDNHPNKAVYGDPFSKKKFMEYYPKLLRGDISVVLGGNHEHRSYTIGRLWDDSRDRGLPMYYAEDDIKGVHWFIVGNTLTEIKKNIKLFIEAKEATA